MNTDNRVSLRELWRDVFENYVALDSRMGHTILPFLFRPGRLTRDFSRGRRIHYVHPVKLYFLTSVLFFFAFSKLVMPDFNRELNDWQQKLELTPTDTLNRSATDSTKNVSLSVSYGDRDTTSSNEGFRRFYQLASRRDLSSRAFADSLNMADDKTPSEFELFVAGQIQKIFRNDVALFIGSIVQNTPLVVLVILPLLAFLLRLFYWRWFYVEHLVLALHWQSFTYVLFIIGMIVQSLGVSRETVAIGVIVLLAVYSILLLSRFYEEYWIWTSIKLGFIVTFYISILSVAISINAVLSVFLF